MGKQGTARHTSRYRTELPPDSLAEGICRQVDPDLFFPIGNQAGRPSAEQQLRWAQAKAICRRCPVVDDCLTWALDTGDDVAVLGATTPAERRAMRRKASELVAA
jgi:WhiB family redox-sensing transcriptional regulator